MIDVDPKKLKILLRTLGSLAVALGALLGIDRHHHRKMAAHHPKREQTALSPQELYDSNYSKYLDPVDGPPAPHKTVRK